MPVPGGVATASAVYSPYALALTTRELVWIGKHRCVPDLEGARAAPTRSGRQTQSFLRPQKRWPVVDCSDIKARRRGKGSRDVVEFMLRDHFLDTSKAVRGSLFCELHGGLRSEISIAQDDIIHRGAALRIVAF